MHRCGSASLIFFPAHQTRPGDDEELPYLKAQTAGQDRRLFSPLLPTTSSLLPEHATGRDRNDARPSEKARLFSTHMPTAYRRAPPKTAVYASQAEDKDGLTVTTFAHFDTFLKLRTPTNASYGELVHVVRPTLAGSSSSRDISRRPQSAGSGSSGFRPQSAGSGRTRSTGSQPAASTGRAAVSSTSTSRAAQPLSHVLVYTPAPPGSMPAKSRHRSAPDHAHSHTHSHVPNAATSLGGRFAPESHQASATVLAATAATPSARLIMAVLEKPIGSLKRRGMPAHGMHANSSTASLSAEATRTAPAASAYFTPNVANGTVVPTPGDGAKAASTAALTAALDPDAGGGSRFATVFHSADRFPIACKRAMSREEQLYFLRHGVTPPRTLSRPELPAPQGGDAAAFYESKQAVHALVMRREAAVEALRELLPSPQKAAQARHATSHLLLEPTTAAVLRARLANRLHALRLATAAVCEGLALWREQLRARGGYFGSLPSEEVAYLYEDRDYELTMVSDVASVLPAPIALEPLLIDWFDVAVPWLAHAAHLAHHGAYGLGARLMSISADGSAVAEASAPAVLEATRYFGLAHADVLAPFHEAGGYTDVHGDLSAVVGTTTAGGDAKAVRARLKRAQETLLAQVARKSGQSAAAPSAEQRAHELWRHAARRSRPPSASDFSCSRWRWTAYEWLLYGGGEVYAPLLHAMPRYFRFKALSEAASFVQRCFRGRLLLRFTRMARQLIMARRAKDTAARLVLETRWAVYIQNRYRGMKVRETLRTLVAQGLANDREAKMRALREFQAKQEAREHARVVDKAVRKLQSHAHVLNARAAFMARQRRRAAESAHAAVSLSGSDCVAKLEAVMVRHRIVKGVLRDVYTNVCVAYEDRALERETAEVRASDWFPRTQQATDAAVQQQRQLAAQLVALVEESPSAAAAAKAAGSSSSAKQQAAKASAASAFVANAAKGESGAEAAAEAAEAAYLMPDVLGLRALLWKEVRKEQAALSKLEAEVHMWARLRQTHGGGDEASEPLTGPKVAELQAAQSRQVIAAQQQQRVASQEEALAAWPTPPILEGRRTPPRASHVLCMVEGALGALDQAEEWKVPGTTGQRALLASVQQGASAAAQLEAQRATTYEHAAAEYALVEGENRALRELRTLHEGVDQRIKQLRLAATELNENGVTLKVRNEVLNLPAANLAEAISPGLPPAPSATTGKGTPSLKSEWDAWFVTALEAHERTAARLLKADADREASAKAELDTARGALDTARTRLAQAEALLETWLRLEGSKRLLASVHAKERRRLRRELIGKRTRTFAKMFAMPTYVRVQTKRAQRELHRANAAARLAERLATRPVQARRYTEGTVSLTVLDSMTKALSELLQPEPDTEGEGEGSAMPSALPRDERWQQLTRSVNMLVGDMKGERVYIQTLVKTTVTLEPGTPGRRAESGSASAGQTQPEPQEVSATLLELAVRHRPFEGTQDGPKPAASILLQLEEAHASGLLAQTLGVPHASIKSFGSTPPKEELDDAPTLLQLLQETSERRAAAAAELHALQQKKARNKENTRVWHRLKGALAFLKDVDADQAAEDAGAAESGASSQRRSGSVWTARKKRPATAAEGVVDDSSAAGFASRWLGVGDLMRAHVAVAIAQRSKEARRALKAELDELESEIATLHELQRSCLRWKPVCVPRSATVIDVAWNVGLDEGQRATGDSCFCYHCASLSPPVKVRHRFVDCPKRRKHNMPEFDEGAMKSLSRELRQRSATSQGVLDELSAFDRADENARLKRDLFELAGAIKVLGKQDGVLPRPCQPAPPPHSARASLVHERRRKRDHLTEHLTKLVAIAARHESGAVHHIPGSWGELKATALMKPQRRLGDDSVVTPETLLDAAKMIGLDISATGHDHHMMDVVIEQARMPLPSHWEELEDDEGEEGQGADGEGAKAPAAAAAAQPLPLPLPSARRYLNLISGEECTGHPMAPTVAKLAASLKVRSQRTGTCKPKLMDAWVQFADGAARLPYFYNFVTGERRRDFPPLDKKSYTPCVLPPYQLEPSAEVLCAAAQETWAGLDSARLERAVKAQLFDSARKRARADVLAHQPCRLEVLVTQGFALGLDAATEPELMWLCDCALAPRLPLGWIASSASGSMRHGDGSEFYWHTVVGLTQWEHPEVSFLTGVAARLVEARRVDVERALGEQRTPTPTATAPPDIAAKASAVLGTSTSTRNRRD
mgnify:CR=1 FL=1